jgi:hypothetical protein
MTTATALRRAEMTGLTPAGDAFRHGLDTELAAATEQAHQAGDDHTEVLAALDRLALMVKALDDTRGAASDESKRLIARALQLGVDPRDLYGRPFSATVVRGIAEQVGIRFERPGPRPRSRPRPE